MESVVKALPEGVRNTMRSGIILYDLTSVVEELVFNSLDAGATKVSVYVGVGTCYVKVVDDGCGVSRDGLVLLGERYVTSKFLQSADVNTANRSFGFRGEALASISEVSLLEIVTKACGRPNGYRKVIKGSKCLYLGINDDRKDAGTTVIVRDLFYNQPVRRKHMHSSTKKVLHLVKKCVYRIALVHPKVSFKVVDIESENELLYMHPSSVLSRLMTGFAIEDSSFFHELNVDGDFHLSGYISGPGDDFITKAFQYVYINSRFVCKGPIHKLLNNLPTRFEHVDPRKADGLFLKGKRSRPQPYPAYILNLCCPSSLYDLTFEPSKTHAEFKDWVPVLTFIEKAIQQLWGQSIACGESSSCATDIFEKDEIWKDCKDMASVEEDFLEIQNPQSSHLLDSSPLEIVTKEVDHTFSGGNDRVPHKAFYLNVSEFKEQQAVNNAICQSGHSVQSWKMSQKSDNHSLKFDHQFWSPDDYFLEDRFTDRQRCSDGADRQPFFLDESPKIASAARNDCNGSLFSLESLEFSNELEAIENRKKPFPQSCCIGRKGAVLTREEGFEFPIDSFKTKRRRFSADENVYTQKKVDVSDQIFDIFPRTSRKNEAIHAKLFPMHFMGVDMHADFDILSGDSVKSFSSCRNPLAEERHLGSVSVMHTESYDSGCHSLYSESCSTSYWDVEHLSDDNDGNEEHMRLGNRENHWHFQNGNETKSKSRGIMSNSSSQDNCIPSAISTVLEFNNSVDSDIDICKFVQENNLCNDFSVEHSGLECWSLLDSDFKDHKCHDQNKLQPNQLRYRDGEQDLTPRGRSIRSHSAPPFYRRKSRFISLNHHLMADKGKPCGQLVQNGIISTETDDLKHPYFLSNCSEDLDFSSRPNKKNRREVMPEKEPQEGQNFEHSQYVLPQDMSVKGFTVKGIGASMDYSSKWRNDSQKVAKSNAKCVDNQHDILNISSGFLHLAGKSLVPESIHRSCLVDAKVLLQVDKKFIPVVAGRTLAVIDQHAADERIRIEDLRQKVLSGEAKTVSYLDAQKELQQNLPEIGYQLLNNYAEQIRDWGWICNIQAQASGTFKKSLNILHQQPTIVTLLAVPCILGVELSDVDLLEYIQQLADTDGSSTMPPSVLRILNYKACRGAIMFGDSLLPSECALIVEELKQTSLCFQCAHGRPTTVPLVNLEALHKQIDKLGVVDDNSNKLWHGLRRQELSLERAAKRLSTARGHFDE